MLVVVVEPLELLLALQRLVDLHAKFGPDQLRDPVDLGERQLVHPPDIADRGAGLHRAEGDDLRDVAVFLADVLEDLGAAVLAQVDVDVRILAAVGIGEAFEQKPVAHRAGVREAERVADHGADARATGGGRDAAFARLVDEVPDDQEVGADLLAGEDGELVVEAATVRILDPVAVAPDQTRLTEFTQSPVAVGVERGQFLLAGLFGQGFDPVARAEAGEPEGAARCRFLRLSGQRRRFRALDPHQGSVVGGEVELDVAAVRDPARVRHGLRGLRVGEELVHLLGALDVELLRVVEPVLVLLVLAGRDADQRVVAVPVLGGQEVGVVVAHQGQVEFPGEAQNLLVDPVLLGRVVPLQFQVEAGFSVLVGRERVQVPQGLFAGVVPVHVGAGLDVPPQVVGERGAQVAVDRDQPLVPLPERLLVHPRLVVEALEETVRRELHEVAPSRLVAGQQDQVEPPVGDALTLLVAAVGGLRPDVRRYIGLDAQDRLDALLAAGLVEGNRAVQIAVIREGDRVHAEPLDAVDEGFHPVAPVEQRVLGVEVEVDEVRGHAR